MRSLFIVLISTGIALAQTPAPAKPAAAAKAAPKAGTATAKTATAKAAVPAPLGPTAAQRVKLMNPASLKAVAPAEYKVQFVTLKDQSFVVDIHRDWAPLGADRFYNLVKNGFFTGVRFYRVAPGFVIQFGPSPDPKITLAWRATHIKDDAVKEKNTKYRLTFAMGGPNTRTTQLFFNLRDNSPLDGMGFAPIGEVVDGTETVDGIYSGYGEIAEQNGPGPSQRKLAEEGEKYLKASFDKLDTIKSATVISGEPPKPAPAKPAAAKPAAAPKKAAPAAKK